MNVPARNGNSQRAHSAAACVHRTRVIAARNRRLGLAGYAAFKGGIIVGIIILICMGLLHKPNKKARVI